MYVPKHFAEDRLDVLAAFVREHPFATLVSPLADGSLFASHIPMLWEPAPPPYGRLVGHVARPNPHGAAPGGDALAIFLGPQAYVSPSWFPSKAEHGKVVPTWNYVAVHVRGALRTIDDPEWLRDLVARLTERHERSFATPWQVTDAPPAFLDAMLRGIVGVEITVRSVEGKWKLSQNRPPADFAGVIDGLRTRGDADSAALAAAMTAWRREHGG